MRMIIEETTPCDPSACPDQERDQAIEYFVEQYRQMFTTNLDDYRNTFEDLKYADLMSSRPN